MVAVKKPTNMAKTSEVLQKQDESLTDLSERLCKAFTVYTPFDPEAPEHQRLVNAAFVDRLKLTLDRNQKLKVFTGKNATELIEIANNFFVNGDQLPRRRKNEE